MKMLSTKELAEGLRRGDKRLLSKAITLVESTLPMHREQADELLEMLMPFTGKSVRIGITGVPGAGKSTFIESFGQVAIAQGHKVAVLAIDPSSSRNKGSILGDKTRMEELAKSEHAFIRPSPSSGFLGGVANTTFETMLLCEAAGYDYILIETVGVGQSEVLVSEITDVFLFIKIIGGGDELQGIKRGIMEMVDIIFINKVNDTNRLQAKNMKVELKRALHFLPHQEADWKVPVLLGAALEKEGLNDVYEAIHEFIDRKKKSGRLEVIRQQQAARRFEFWVQNYILQRTRQEEEGSNSYQQHLELVSQLQTNPSTEALRFVNKLFNKD